MRHSSACCLGDSFGRRPRSFPLARATAMPSRVRIRTKNSAKVEDVEEHLAHRVGGVVVVPAERRPDVAGSEVVADRASGTERVSRSSFDTRVLGDTQLGQSLALGGAGLGVGAAACVADQSVGHDWGVMDSPPSLRINPYRLFETPLALAVIATSSPTWVSV
jgi:hypothetical protein